MRRSTPLPPRRLRLSLLAASLALAALASPLPAADSSVVVPVVARASGAEGSFWRSDLVIARPSGIAGAAESSARLSLELLPSGPRAGEPPLLVELAEPLAPGATREIADVLATHFPGRSLGALLVRAVDDAGTPVEIVVSSRTYTASPGDEAGGTWGQGVPGISRSVLARKETSPRVIPGLESSDTFRTNLGFVNLSSTLAIDLAVDLRDPSGNVVATHPFHLDPLSHLQPGDLLAASGLAGAGFTADVRFVGAGAPASATSPPEFPVFEAYASRVDRRTNDPSFLEPADSLVPTRGPAAVVVPAAAHAPGASGSFWRTDLSIARPAGDGGDDAVVTLEFIASGPEGSATSRQVVTLPEPLPPGGSRSLPDVVGTLFPGGVSGALVVSAATPAGPLASLLVDSRTWTPAGADEGAGSFGQAIPGIPWGRRGDPASAAGDLSLLWLPGIEESDLFRTNVGLVNGSPNSCLTVDVEILDAGGTPVGTVTESLQPWSHRQIADLPGAVGAHGAGYSARLRVVASDDLGIEPSAADEPALFAYLSRVDRRTNDPTYLSAVPVGTFAAGTPVAALEFASRAPWFVCPSSPDPEGAVVLRALDRVDHYFGAENRRDVWTEVDFPASRNWSQVGLRMKLECPASNDCDDWDRVGGIQLVLNPDAPREAQQPAELLRLVTPYNVGMCMLVDVTHLAPLLVGRQTLHSFIDTWVGPGHSDGDGWRLTAEFVFVPGPRGGPDRVLNVHGRRIVILGYDDDARDVASQTPPIPVRIPATATRVDARIVTTGHGWGNTTGNCAEFCRLRQDLYVNGERWSHDPWRGDCERNPVNPQGGTWKYDRNGWCPGTVALGKGFDVSTVVVPGADNLVDYDVRKTDGSEYVNNGGHDFEPQEHASILLSVWE